MKRGRSPTPKVVGTVGTGWSRDSVETRMLLSTDDLGKTHVGRPRIELRDSVWSLETGCREAPRTSPGRLWRPFVTGIHGVGMGRGPRDGRLSSDTRK